MNKPNQKDQRNEMRHEVSQSRKRLGLFVRLGLLALMMMIALGNRGCIDDRPPTITCDEVPVLVEAGTCTTFQNPCREDQWLRPDLPEGFRLEPETEEERVFIRAHQLSLRETRVSLPDGAERTRSLCAGPDAPLGQKRIPFTYALSTNYGTNSLLVTVAPVLTVTATASPSAISAGESSQLVAQVSGGIPPYFYSWVPTANLNDDDIAAPIARPNFTTTYRVGVADSGGQQKEAEVTIFVDFDVAVTASPSTINLGENSQLEANAVGGTPPYTYSWTPTVGLNDPLRGDPVSTPTATTTYTAQVTDATGATREGSATITVAAGPSPVTASFVFNIINGNPPTVNLDASASTGPIVSYTWDLSWTAVSPDRVTSSPTTSFTFEEGDRGTITLTVTGIAGDTATVTRNFPSAGSSPNRRLRGRTQK